MSTVIKSKNAIIYTNTKLAFVIYLFSQFLFDHTIINQIAMIFLCFMMGLTCLSKRKIHFNIYFVFTLCFITQSYIFSYNGISIDPKISLEMAGTLVFNLLISLVIYNYIMIYENLEKSLFTFAGIGLIFTIAVMLFSVGHTFDERLTASIQILGNTVEYDSNAVSLIAGFTYLIYLYKFNINKNKRYLIYFIWLIFVVVLSGSRKGVMLMVMGTCILIFVLNPKKKIRNTIIATITLFMAYFAIMDIPFLYNVVGYRLEALFDFVLGKEVNETSVETRSFFIEKGWEYFLRRPWTGYGIDCFRAFYLSGSYVTYSHNNYIELLVGGGIPALVFYYVMRIVVIIKLYTKKSGIKINKILFVLIFLLIIMDYAIVTYYDRIYIIIFIFALCGSQSVISRRKSICCE